MAIFMDIELVSIQEAEPPGAYSVAFDVIYAGETWRRSIVDLDKAGSARLGRDEQAQDIAQEVCIAFLAVLRRRGGRGARHPSQPAP